MFQRVDFNYNNSYNEEEFIKNVKEQFNHWNKYNQTFYEDCLGMDCIHTIIKEGGLKYQKDLIIYYQGSIFKNMRIDGLYHNMRKDEFYYNMMKDEFYYNMCQDMIMENLWKEFD